MCFLCLTKSPFVAKSKQNKNRRNIMTQRNFTIVAEVQPNISGMQLATVIALKELGGQGTNQEISERVIKNEPVSEEEQQIPMSKDARTKLNYYLGWVRTYLKREKVLENPARGVWALTEIGNEINSLEDIESL